MSGATSKHAWLTPDTAPTATRCRRIRIPDDETWIAAVSGALTPLIYAYNWELFGTLTPEEAAERAQTMVLEYFESDCMIGSIIAYATIDPPNGCIECDGGTYNRADYPVLYDALDPIFIIDADTLQTPDLRGRTVIGAGSGTDLTPRDMGDTGGVEAVTLTEAQLAAHTHTTQPHSHTYNYPTFNLDLEAPGAPDIFGAGNPPVPSITSAETVSVNSTGGDEAHENMPPFFALKYAMVAR